MKDIFVLALSFRTVVKLSAISPSSTFLLCKCVLSFVKDKTFVGPALFLYSLLSSLIFSSSVNKMLTILFPLATDGIFWLENEAIVASQILIMFTSSFSHLGESRLVSAENFLVFLIVLFCGHFIQVISLAFIVRIYNSCHHWMSNDVISRKPNNRNPRYFL